jgi:hypothetical protein
MRTERLAALLRCHRVSGFILSPQNHLVKKKLMPAEKPDQTVSQWISSALRAAIEA